MAENSTKNNKNLILAIILASQLGFFIAIPLIFLLLFGLFFDKKFNSFPLFLIISLISSPLVIILEVRYLISPFLEKRSKEKK